MALYGSDSVPQIAWRDRRDGLDQYLLSLPYLLLEHAATCSAAKESITNYHHNQSRIVKVYATLSDLYILI